MMSRSLVFSPSSHWWSQEMLASLSFYLLCCSKLSVWVSKHLQNERYCKTQIQAICLILEGWYEEMKYSLFQYKCVKAKEHCGKTHLGLGTYTYLLQWEKSWTILRCSFWCILAWVQPRLYNPEDAERGLVSLAWTHIRMPLGTLTWVEEWDLSNASNMSIHIFCATKVLISGLRRENATMWASP